MKNINYKELYINYVDKIMKKILIELRESFIEYYGIENKHHIDEIFDTLLVSFYSIYQTKESFDYANHDIVHDYQEITSVLLNERKDLKEEDLVNMVFSSNNELFDSKETEELYNVYIQTLFSYCRIKLQESKIIEGENTQILYTTKKISILDEEYLKNLFTDIHLKGGFVSNADLPVVCIRIKYDGFIPILTIIHEINHAIKNILLATIEQDDKKPKKLKLSGTKELFEDSKSMYTEEALNEYQTIDIYNIFKKKSGAYILDDEYKSTYILLDEILGFPAKEIHEILKEEIRKNLLKHNIIKNIINGENNTYKRLEELYLKVFNIKEEEIKLKKSNKLINYKYQEEQFEKLRKEAKILVEEVRTNYTNYLIYDSEIKKTVNELIQNGTARKIK